MSTTTSGYDVTEGVIRDVALRHFARIGYEGATMRAIAADVGIKASSLYNHFSSKQDLLWDLAVTALDALEAGWAAAQGSLAQGSNPADQLVAFVASHVRFHATHSTQAALVNGNLQGLTAERYQHVVSRRDAYAEELIAILARGQRERSLGVPDTQLAAYAILQMGMGVAIWYRADGPRSVDELCAAYAAIALKIVSTLGPSGRWTHATAARGERGKEA